LCDNIITDNSYKISEIISHSATAPWTKYTTQTLNVEHNSTTEYYCY